MSAFPFCFLVLYFIVNGVWYSQNISTLMLVGSLKYFIWIYKSIDFIRVILTSSSSSFNMKIILTGFFTSFYGCPKVSCALFLIIFITNITCFCKSLKFYSSDFDKSVLSYMYAPGVNKQQLKCAQAKNGGRCIPSIGSISYLLSALFKYLLPNTSVWILISFLKLLSNVMLVSSVLNMISSFGGWLNIFCFLPQYLLITLSVVAPWLFSLMHFYRIFFIVFIKCLHALFNSILVCFLSHASTNFN